MNRFYKRSSFNNAKDLRKNQTEFESILWNRLRDRRLNSIKFRRQVPIGSYIVDFVAMDKKLVIELDGSQHLTENSVDYDKKRTEALKQCGYIILRINNNDINNDLDGVLNKIADMHSSL